MTKAIKYLLIGIVAVSAFNVALLVTKNKPAKPAAVSMRVPPTTEASPLPTTTTTSLTTLPLSTTAPNVTVTEPTLAPSTSVRIATVASTTTKVRLTPLAVAQSELGKAGVYSEGGFWCAKFVSWVAVQAEVSGFKGHESPAGLHGIAVKEGRITELPQVGQLVFIDLFGPAGNGGGQVSHVAVVETVDGNNFTTIGRNSKPGNDTVVRENWSVGDKYAVAYANWQ